MRRRLHAAVAVAAVAALGAGAATARPHGPTVHFSVAAHVPLKLTDVLWTGTRFLVVDNTTNRVFEVTRNGTAALLFATMPNVSEETRCIRSPGRYGFPAGGLFCHSPDNVIYRIGADGSAQVFARLADRAKSDGALAFDDVGRFGHVLLAVGGRSNEDGGSVWTIDARGTARKLGTYPGPGGADNAVVAPASFGTQGGSLLFSLDKDTTHGGVVAVDPKGVATTIVQLPDGANPIAVVPQRLRTTGTPPAGFYVVDTFPGNVLTAAASQFAAYRGDVLVGTEIHGWIFAVAPKGNGFVATKLVTDLNAKQYNLEGATFVP